MTILSSTRNKIILLLLISMLIFAAWQAGLEIAYAKVLVGTTNFRTPDFSQLKLS